MSIAQRVPTRPTYPPGWLVGQLPVGMHEDELLVRFTTIFERVAEGLRGAADTVEHVADTSVTTPDMLIYMGRWLGYDLLDPGLDLPRQRTIIAALGQALPMRGTAIGLRTLLEAVTDGPVLVEEPGGVIAEDEAFPAAHGVTVTVASTGHLREHELLALVRDEVPAHLPVTLSIDAELEGEAS